MTLGVAMSGRIPREFIDDLLVRIDIVDLVDTHVPLKKSGSNFVARCPFHTEKTPSFTVNRNKQLFHCFGCGASGNAIGFIMDFNHLDFGRFIRWTSDVQDGIGLTQDRRQFLACQLGIHESKDMDEFGQFADYCKMRFDEVQSGKPVAEHKEKSESEIELLRIIRRIVAKDMDGLEIREDILNAQLELEYEKDASCYEREIRSLATVGIISVRVTPEKEKVYYINEELLGKRLAIIQKLDSFTDIENNLG